MAEETKSDKPHVYTDLNEVPERWRTYKGARLNVDQVNGLVAKSYELSGNLSGLATAREEFEKTHKAQGGVWVSKSEEEIASEAANVSEQEH